MSEETKFVDFTEVLDERDAVVASAFIYRQEMGLKTVSSNFCSSSQIDAYYREGRLLTRELLVMRFLYEMGEMTLSQIQMAFSHPSIDSDILKISLSGSNPYQSDVQKLERLDMLRVMRLTVRGKDTLKIYGLSKSAAAWFKENFGNSGYLFDKNPEYAFKLPCETALTELSHLAAVTAHIKFVTSSLDVLEYYSPVLIEGANVYKGAYKFQTGESILTFPVRDASLEGDSVRRALSSSYLDASKAFIVLLVPSERTMFDLRELIKPDPSYSDDKVMYLSDLSAKDATNFPYVYRCNDSGFSVLSLF